MRTYSHLIRYSLDLEYAQKSGLIPKERSVNNANSLISWDDFAIFIAWFENLDDSLISPRCSYGELRLTRLNSYAHARCFLGKLTFHHVHAQWGPFLNSFIAPFVAMFLIITVVLNAMQVELAAQCLDNPTIPAWVSFARTAKWVSVLVLLVALFVAVSLLEISIFMAIQNIYFAQNCLWEKKDPVSSWKSKKSGVI